MTPKRESPHRGGGGAGSGGRIRTGDLRVMSPTSCHCSTPRQGRRQRPIVPATKPPVSSAQARCTTVFGTGTGGATPLESPPAGTPQACRCGKQETVLSNPREGRLDAHEVAGARVAPSALSTPRLQRLPAFHPGPIHQLVSLGPYSLRMGDLILGRASHLDAFSAYRDRTTATEPALGGTAHPPAVRPPRSSRTRGGAPQVSYAHDG